MVKKVKEMNPKQKIDQGKCANPNATTISFFIIKQLCAACQIFATIPEQVKLFKLGLVIFQFHVVD